MTKIITGQPYDWSTGTAPRECVSPLNPNKIISVPQFEIRIWCTERHTNRPFLVRVPYNNYCIVEVNSRGKGNAGSWTPNEIGAVKGELMDRRSSTDCPVSCQDLSGGKFYYADFNKYLYFECRFYNQQNMWNFYNNINNRYISIRVQRGKYHQQMQVHFKVHEHKIDPITKFLVQYSPRHGRFKFGHASWLQVKGTFEPDHLSISTLKQEILFDTCRPGQHPLTVESSANLHIYDPETSGCDSWTVNPVIMSFDLECQPEVTSRFPIANIGDQIHMNSVIVQRHNKPETRVSYYFIVGDCLPSKMFPNCKIIRCRNEDELIRGFERLILDHDPDFIIGYNIDQFDCLYLHDRLRSRGKNWSYISRIKNTRPKLEDMSWESKQRGWIDVFELYMEGRPTFDVMQWVKAEHKLSLYNLGFVSEHFLDQAEETKKLKISMKDMIKTYDWVKRVFQKESPQWPTLRQYAPPDNPSSTYQAALEALELYVDYTIGDSTACLDIFEKLGGCTVLSEFTGPLGLPIRYLYRKGQTVKVISQIYRITRRMGVILTDRPKQESFKAKGGHVAHPIPGLQRFAFMVDFKSMYPSIMEEYNIDHTTYVRAYDNQITENMVNSINAERELEDGTIIYPVHKFLKQEYKKGIIPINVSSLINERDKVKGQLKRTKKGTTEHRILDARQLALKVAANSNFGFTLRPTGQYTFQEVGESITAAGRNLIKWCNDLLEKDLGYPVVYNDTDSSASSIPGLTDYKQGYELAMKATDYVNRKLSDRHSGRTILKVEMEKAMRILLLGPKFYVYFEFNAEGQVIEDPRLSNVRGVPLARRDKPPIMIEIYRDLLFNLMIAQPLDYIYDLLFKHLFTIVYRQMPPSMFAIIKKLGSSYKDENFNLAVFAEELAKRGRPARPGDRLEYIVMRSDNKDLKQGYRSWLIEEYFEWLGWVDAYYAKDPKARDLQDIAQERWLSIDYDYYLDFISEQTDKVFQIVMGPRISSHIDRRPAKVCLGVKKHLVAKPGPRAFTDLVYTSKLFWMSNNVRPVTAFIKFRKLKAKCLIQLVKKVREKEHLLFQIEQKLDFVLQVEQDLAKLSHKFQKHGQLFEHIARITQDCDSEEINAEITNMQNLLKNIWSWLPPEKEEWILQSASNIQWVYSNFSKLTNTDLKIWTDYYQRTLTAWQEIGRYLQYCVQFKHQILSLYYQLQQKKPKQAPVKTVPDRLNGWQPTSWKVAAN